MFGLARYNYDQFNRNSLAKDFLNSKFGSAPDPGDEAPDFTLRSIDGEKVTLSDYQGEKNVLLTFGSATCPQTAATIGGIKDLFERFNDQDVEFLFVYVREAHPGRFMPAHRSMDDKIQAAELLRDEEAIESLVLVDELHGRVHRKYGSLPNASFLIDKSGRIAFRSLGSRAKNIADATVELLKIQEERGVDHAVVAGGEDAALPPLNLFLHAHRALERGGEDAIRNFREQMGFPGRVALIGGRMAQPVVEHPATAVMAFLAAAGVIALGLWTGAELRRKRFNQRPYRMYDAPSHRKRGVTQTDDYAVGI
jgi:peroxiredoxin